MIFKLEMGFFFGYTFSRRLTYPIDKFLLADDEKIEETRVALVCDTDGISVVSRSTMLIWYSHKIQILVTLMSFLPSVLGIFQSVK